MADLIHRPFKSLSPDIFSIIINLISDHNIFTNCLFIDKRFLRLIYERYYVKKKIKYHHSIKFANFNQINIGKFTIAGENGLDQLIPKCRNTLHFSFLACEDFDSKKLNITAVIPHYINTVNLNPLLLKLHCRPSTCKFPNAENLDITIHSTEVSGLEVYLWDNFQFNPSIRKLKIHCSNTHTVYNCNFNEFLHCYTQLTELFLFVDSILIHTDTFVIPERIKRFGITPNTFNSKMITLDLTNSNLEELCIWDTTESKHQYNFHHQRIKIIPPINNHLNKLNLMAMAPYEIANFLRLRSINELIIQEGNSTTFGSPEQMNVMLGSLYDISSMIHHLKIIGGTIITGVKNKQDIKLLTFNPRVQNLTLEKVAVPDVEIVGDKLDSITILNMEQIVEIGRPGKILLPDHVINVTCDTESVNYIIFPKGIGFLRVCVPEKMSYDEKLMWEKIERDKIGISEIMKIPGGPTVGADIVFCDIERYLQSNEIQLES